MKSWKEKKSSVLDTRHEQVKIKLWTSHEQVKNKSWTSHEQVMIKSWLSHVQEVNKAWTSYKEVMKKSWRCHEGLINKLWTRHEQTPWSLVINKVNKNYGTYPLYHLSRGGWVHIFYLSLKISFHVRQNILQ